MADRVERNFKGHFIAAESCRWFRTTDVGDYRISSIGDYRPTQIAGFPRDTQIGWGRTYETMVFPLSAEVHECDDTDCAANGARIVANWSGVGFDGYNSADDAARGHEAMVQKCLAGHVSPITEEAIP